MSNPDLKPLLDLAAWTGRVHDSGQWIEPQGGARDVLEPATGSVLMRSGVANAVDMKRPAFSDEVAPVIAFLCEDASRWVSGINLPVDGGLASTYV